MENLILCFFPIALLFISLYQCENSKKDFSDKIWSHNQAKMIEAIACIGVILHHVTQRVTSYGVFYKGPITVFNSIGFLFTSLFFFFSGYGLITSVINKPNYLDNFLLHRLSTILIPFFVSNIIYVVAFRFYVPMSSDDILRSVFGLVLLNGNGWYIVEIFILYIIFYILFKTIKNKNIAIILLCTSAIVIIMIGAKSGHDYTDIGDLWFKGEWWFNSTIVFNMGILFARFKDRIVAFLKKRYSIFLSVTAVLFPILFVIEEKINHRYGYYQSAIKISGVNCILVTLIAQSTLAVIFTFLILLINMKITFNSVILKFISSISVELFLIHGIFVRGIEVFRFPNNFIKYVFVIFCGIVAAKPFLFIDKKLITGFTNLKIFRKKTYLEDCERDLIRERKEKKSKLTKKVLIALVSLGLCIIFIGNIVFYYVVKPIECKIELEGLKSSKVGDIVKYGRYEQNHFLYGKEKVEWIVLEKTEDEIILISEKGLSGCSYHQKHSQIGWSESDIYKYLNEDMFNEMFSDNEKEHLIENIDTMEFVTLLTPDEAKVYFKDNVSRQIKLTDVAYKQGVNINTYSKVNYWDEKEYRSSWWWLKGDETEKKYAPIVTVDGAIETDTKYVNKPNGAVRPVIHVSIL